MKMNGTSIVIAACVLAGLQSGLAQTNDIRLGNMKAGKILFLGNSITAVPLAEGKPWWGASASDSAKDYAHLLAATIEAKAGGKLTLLPTTGQYTKPDGSVDQNDSNVINIADVFERGYASYNAAKVAKQLAWKADIVILQFGEDIPPATFNADVFKTGLKKLVADLKESSNPHIFMAGYILGANSTVDGIKGEICAEDPTHRVFVDMSGVGKDPANIGALAHPSDKGMALIAQTLLNAILAHSATVASAPLTVSPPAAGIRKDVGKFFAVDPAQVKVGGEIGRRMDLAIQKNLLAIEVDNQFLRPFRQKQSRAMDYVGIGKLIDATLSFAHYSKDPKVVELKDRLVKELLATQLDDGYLGSFPAGARIVQLFDEHEMADVPVASKLIVRLRQETDYPNSGKVVIKVDPSRPAEFPLNLRIPRWCESAAVSVAASQRLNKGANMTETQTNKLVVINRGRCGQNSGILREKFTVDVLQVRPKPDYVLIYIGMNDVINDQFFTPLDKYLENMTWLIEQARKAGITPVICTIHKVNETVVYAHHPREKFGPETVNEKRRRYNTTLKKLAADQKVALADFDAVTAALAEADFLSDGVHLTLPGNKLLARTFLDLIAPPLRGSETIVCVGDSLTYGYLNQGAGSAEGETYPAMLRQGSYL